MGKRENYELDLKKYKFMKKVATPFVKSKFNFIQKKPIKMPDVPFILVCNHVTNLDMVWVGCSIDKHLYFVSSEHVVRKGIGGKLLENIFHPIVREKATVGLSTVVEMKNHLLAGHNVGIFAEGVRSADGLSNKIVPSTAAVIKKLGFTLVTFKVHGGFLSSPRWASDVRRGEITTELVNIYTPEDIKSLSAKELDAKINEDIFEDAYAYNETRKIAYKSKKLAEGIEFELVVCPKCRKFSTIKSQNNRFMCDCGLKGVYNEYGLLSGEGFDFTKIPEWDIWQKDEIAKFVKAMDKDGEEVTIISHPNQELREVSKDHTERVVATGALSLSNRYLSVGDKKIAIEDISGYDIFFHGYLLIFTKDKKYYEISNPKYKYPGYLYKLLIENLITLNTGK